jgi:hypothetical protein
LKAKSARIGLESFGLSKDCAAVKCNKTSAVVLSALVLTASHAAGVLSASSKLDPQPQAAEAKTQETVDLKISGMT